MEVFELLSDARLLVGPRFVAAALWEFIRRGKGSVAADVPMLKSKIFPGQEFDDAIFRDWLRQLKECGVIELIKRDDAWVIVKGSGKFALADGPKRPRKAKAAKIASPVILRYPCQGKIAEWCLTEAQVEEWQRLYPGLDILQCCRSALAYIAAGEMKTARGMARYLVGWFDRDVRWGAKSSMGAFGALRNEAKPRGDLSRAFAEFGTTN